MCRCKMAGCVDMISIHRLKISVVQPLGITDVSLNAFHFEFHWYRYCHLVSLLLSFVLSLVLVIVFVVIGVNVIVCCCW